MSGTRRAGLGGGGLSTLIPSTIADRGRTDDPVGARHIAGPGLVPVPGLRLAELDVDRIRPNGQQPRRRFDDEALRELADSIRENGVLQPVVVRPLPADAGAYELVMGERRLRASKLADRRTIPALVKETADDRMLHEALLENLHRSELNPIEEASAYQQLIEDFHITHDRLGATLGRSRPAITNALRLLTLPRDVQDKVVDGLLSAGHARAVLSVKQPELMASFAERILQDGLSVRQAEAAANKIGGPNRLRKAKGRRSEHLDEVSDRLGDRFNTRVRVDLNASRGRIVIDFATVADLNRILAELGDPGWPEGEARELALAEARDA